jgi:hypothetical protein
MWQDGVEDRKRLDRDFLVGDRKHEPGDPNVGIPRTRASRSRSG